MTTLPVSHRAHRRSLLGGAGAVLAAVLAGSPAFAQVATVQANGVRVLVNQQDAPSGTTRGAATSSPDQNMAGGDVERSDLVMSDNSMSGTARTNQAIQAISPLPLTTDEHHGGTSLSASPSAVAATGASVIASRQSTTNSLTYGDVVGSTVGINADRVTESRLALTGNSQEGIALGNDASAVIAVTSASTDSGSGIVTSQTAGPNAVVAAQGRGLFSIITGVATGSDIANSGNLERAIAQDNATDNRISADMSSLEVPAGERDASIVPTRADGTARGTAAFAILSHQTADGKVTARTGDARGAGTVRTDVHGGVTGTSVADDRNTVVAGANGNMSTNAQVLKARSITGPRDGERPVPGAVATTTNFQRAGGAVVEASLTGGVATSVHGPVTGSRMSTSQNSAGTTAVVNRAAGNRLEVDAGAIDIEAQGNAGDANGPAVLQGSVALASNAAFSVQSAQDYGMSSVLASQFGKAMKTDIDGPVLASTVKSDDNRMSAAATGNDATNDLALTATSLRATAAVNNLQLGAGNVTTSVGNAGERSGTLVDIGNRVDASSLSASGNDLSGTAIGQVATNSISATANQIANGRGTDGAAAGPIGTNYGAVGTLALANNQRLHMSDDDAVPIPVITSTVYGQAAISAGDRVTGSSVSLDGNAQRSEALGNSALNRLAVTAATMGGGAGAALSSYQYGQAKLSATSDTRLIAPSALTSSSVSLTGNTNTALAALNDVDSRLRIDAGGLTETPAPEQIAAIDQKGPPHASGDHVLTNQQFAAGSVNAAASTMWGGGPALADGAAVRLTFANNVSAAEAAANRARNVVWVDIGLEGLASAGLANSQTSVAPVLASAGSASDGSTAAPSAARLADTSLTVDGNATTVLARGNAVDNALNLAGAAVADGAIAASRMVSRASAAQATLGNAQTNWGQVAASATDTVYRVPLNGPAAVRDTVMGITGNAVTAQASGNAASNAVTLTGLGRLPSATVTNVQRNFAAVSAQVSGSPFLAPGSTSASSLSMNGNVLAGTAVGNQASNLINAAR